MIYPVNFALKGSSRVAGTAVSLPLSFFHLAHLLEAGVSLSEALLDVKSEESRGRMRHVWSDVCARVEEGKTLSAALSAWPRVFDPVVVALIRAGEASGRLAESCQTIQTLMQWHAAIKARLITVLIYPCFALMIMLGVIGFLFVFVVPSMQVFLSSNNSGIAWHTSVLLYLSGWLSMYMLPFVGVMLLVMLVGLFLYQYSSFFRYYCDRCLLQTPIVGRLVAELSMSRYAKTISRLYGSGLSLEESLKISESVVENTALTLELGRIRYQMLAGTSLGRSIQAAQFVPNTFKKLLAAGESSAALEQAMSQAGEHLHQSAEHSINRLEKLTGPVLLLVIGLNLLWIVVSVLAPVYDAAISTVMSS